MWIWLRNEAGECVIDPIDASRTLNFIDLSPLNGQLADDCVDIFARTIGHLTPINKIGRLRQRLTDAKHHLKSVLAKKVGWSDRLIIIFEVIDILFGQEASWVTSAKNTVKLLEKLVQAARDHSQSIVVIQNTTEVIGGSPAETQDTPIEPLPKLTEEAIVAEAQKELAIEKLAITRDDTFCGTSPYAAQVEFESGP